MIETERLLLRPFEEGDAEELYAYAKDPRVGPAAGWKPHGSVEESREVIRTVFSAPNTFAVVYKPEGKVIGSAGFCARHGREDGPSDEIGYSLSPEYWGRGLMPEAVMALLRYGFAQLGMREIWCAHYEGNARSRRVIEKCGFTYVFTVRLSDEFYPDRPTLLYVRLREDWEKGEEGHGELSDALRPRAG